MAKLADLAGLSLIGRSANSTGVPAAITGTDGQVARVSGTALGFGTIVAAGIASDAVTTAKILDANVTLAKLANLTGLSVIGVTGTSSATPAAITGTANQFLQVNSAGTSLAFGAAPSVDINGMTAATDFKVLTDYVPVYDTSAGANRKFLGSEKISARNVVNIYTECFSPSINANTSDGFVTGGGITPTSFEGTAAHPGIITLATTGTPAYIACLAATGAVIVGGGKWRFSTCIQTPSTLSDGTTRYTIDAGLDDAGGMGSIFASGTYGIAIHYTDNANSGKWQGYVHNGGSNTVVDLGITVATSTWYTLEFEVNAAGTSIQFYINGTAAGTAVTTDIPTGAMSPCVLIDDTVGTGNRAMRVDFVQLIGELTTAR